MTFRSSLSHHSCLSVAHCESYAGGSTADGVEFFPTTNITEMTVGNRRFPEALEVHANVYVRACACVHGGEAVPLSFSALVFSCYPCSLL